MIARAGLAAMMALAGAACSSPSNPAPQAALAEASAPHDRCGADELKSLVGKPQSEIPPPADPSRRRVYCTTCMVTQDYVPTRLDIVVDVNTGLVAQVKCG